MASVNLDDPLSYELLTMVIQEVEKNALESESRSGILAVMHGPLSAMETVLEAGEKALAGPVGVVTNANTGGIALDADLLDLLGDGAGADRARQYLEECLNCNLRLKFDWQLKPLNMMGQLNGLLDIINGTLDQLAGLVDPFKALSGVCDLLNNLRGFCIPDLIMVVMSLKLLLKKYMAQIMSIKLDWTVVIGPILKGVIDGISLMIDGLWAVVSAPVDCVLNGMRTTNNLWKESRDLLSQVRSIGPAIKSNIDQLKDGDLGTGGASASIVYKDVDVHVGSYEKPISSETGTLHQPTVDVQVRERTGQSTGADLSIPTGFELRSDMRLLEGLRQPGFNAATIMDKMILATQDALMTIEDLFRDILRGLEALKNLVGNGLALNLENLGILLFITDMISLIVMIIKMLGSGRHVTDWCDHLEQNPHLLEQHLRGRFATGDITVESANQELILRRGPQVVGTIKTCMSERSEQDSQIINQWIKDLQGTK